MEPNSPRKNLSAAAAAVLLLVILTAVHVWIHAESSEGFWDGCNEHLSGDYKGACWPFIKDDECGRICMNENSDNIAGTCHTFQCFCWTKCDSKVVAPASTPIRP
ncbi:hypothetical protein SETIT_8G227600v2 [Setaria italica]|uniref:Knottin scorpion toxin-like domain-containing protein n=2 Tax=Setaria TaxID=4554 RepID=A0A368SAK8_SETIT|nr:hypothetical protein SETIT_8G227600v2 [Setaria italica]TKW02343.1 hypothetical protein SEVIR_8G237700v2 [Setaria viridis]